MYSLSDRAHISFGVKNQGDKNSKCISEANVLMY